MRRRRQRGTILVIIALMATGLAVFMALVADSGTMFFQRTRMQVAADAAALGGARLLAQGTNAGIAEAQRLAAANGYVVPPGGATVVENDRMVVNLEAQDMGLVTRLLAIASPSLTPTTQKVAVRSTADLSCQGMYFGARPFGVPDRDFVAGAEYVLKAGAHGSYQGNFQGLSIDGVGASVYAATIAHGAMRTLKVGMMLPTEPGNMAGPTAAGVAALIADDQTSYEAAAAGTWTPRVIIVPLVDASYFNVDGRSNVSLSGFARFYVTYTTDRYEVYGRFIDRLATDHVAGTYQDFAVRLVANDAPAPKPLAIWRE